MSGIAGIFNLDGQPVDPALLARMTAAVSDRGPDGVGHWIDGPVGLGHRMLQTTPESLDEKQPLSDDGNTNLCLIFDGRIDNRDELRAEIESKGARLRSDTDAEIVLRTYEIWGEACPRKIIGDFAFAIWDGRNRQLFCARDFLGIKPFYYYSDARRFLFGSELQQLVADPFFQPTPNEGVVGEYLTGSLTTTEETLYRGILRLTPAHYLVVRRDGIRKGRYWDIDPTKEIKYRTDREYSEHFLSSFQEAVRCRLRSHGRVGAHLSGGMDSSSIVAMAALLLREGRAVDCGFETFSMTYPSDWPCDERGYIKAVSRMCDVKTNFVEPGVPGRSYYIEQAHKYQDFPDFPNGAGQGLPLNEVARAKGFRVMLTGNGGNEWFEGGVDHLADLLRGLKFRKFFRHARLGTVLTGNPSPLSLAFRSGLLPLLPSVVRRTGKLLLRKRTNLPDSISERFATRIGLRKRLRGTEHGAKFSSYAQRRIYRLVTDGTEVQPNEVMERATARQGLEDRHPFHDRRLAEFALAIPEEQRWRNGQTKYILREAMRDHLPEPVLQRKVQGDFSILFVKTLEALGAESAFDRLAVASLGWVEPNGVRRMYREMTELYARNDLNYTTRMWPLWGVLAMELWYRAAFSCEEVSSTHKVQAYTSEACHSVAAAAPISIA
jgi:asparagine synthase (glutamine-hydrolysing)